MEEYNPKKIEQKWQKVWQEQKLYQVSDEIQGKKNEYVLVEFAYPSGNLHVGHWYAFSVPDMYARFRRMQGKNVLYPMGFDAFGLPAENAAIKNKINPREWTFSNIDHMRHQLRSMGASFDWSREIVTASPEYYQWTQWLFLRFLEKGLAYQAETPVNWCPSCKTVLANEQVVTGRCERCESEVAQRSMLQWNIKITDYADRLLKDLEVLDWPQAIKEAQKNWIGKSEGAEIDFKITINNKQQATVSVFTTRPDTIFGATYLVLAPEHPFVQEQITNHKSQITNKSEIEKYINNTKSKSEIDRVAEGREKTGVELKGLVAINPANKEEIPVWIADYVLPHYGTGAIMAVPAHDERDFEFAKKFDLPIKQVIAPHTVDEDNPPINNKKTVSRGAVQVVVKHWSEDKIVQIVWHDFGWKTFVIGGVDEGETFEQAALREAKEETGYINFKNIKRITPELRSEWYANHKDENRYAHMQIFFAELADGSREDLSEEELKKHKVEWVDIKDIKNNFAPISSLEMDFILKGLESPNYLPYVGKGILINSGSFSERESFEAFDEIIKYVGGKRKKTYKLRDWTVSRQRYWGCPIPVIHCEECGVVPVPEKDLPILLPEVEDYLPSDEGASPLSKVKNFVDTECPQCGGKARRETDTFDTFVDSSWYFLAYLMDKQALEGPTSLKDWKLQIENFAHWMPISFYSGGAEHTTMHLLYSRFFHKALSDMDLVNESEPYLRRMNRGLILGPDGQKMSKSQGNVVDPDKEVERLGADTVRIYLAFIGPYNEVGSYPWNPDAAIGVRRFLERVWRILDKVVAKSRITIVMDSTIQTVSKNISNLKMNTAISSLMIISKIMDGEKEVSQKDYETLLKLLAPFAPHIAEEIWSKLGYTTSIHLETWPKYDESKLLSEEVALGIQINGKTRATITVSRNAEESEIRARTLAIPDVQKWLDGKEPKRFIVVSGKIVSIVV